MLSWARARTRPRVEKDGRKTRGFAAGVGARPADAPRAVDRTVPGRAYGRAFPSAEVPGVVRQVFPRFDKRFQLRWVRR